VSPPRLPLAALAGGIAGLALVETLLLDGPDDGLAAVAGAAVAAALLLVVARTPLAGTCALLLLLHGLREAGVAFPSAVWWTVLLLVAGFVAGLRIAPRRAGWLIVPVAGAVALRAGTPHDTATLILAGIRFGGAVAAGALIRHRIERVAALRVECDALRRAVDAGPGAAIAAEQRRVWEAIRPRVEHLAGELPERAAAAAAALRAHGGDAEARLTALRAPALEAFEAMRGLVHALTVPESGAAEAAARVRAAQRRLRAPGPLAVACGALVVAGVAEQIAYGIAAGTAAGSAAAVAVGLLPLLAPRRPVLAGALVGATVLAASALELVGGPTTVQNFAGGVTVAVAAASASRVRGGLALVAVELGLLGGLWAEPGTWPVHDYLRLGLLLLAAWGAGLLLRQVGAEVAAAGAARREAGEALAAVERRAVEGERVRLAGELHDLVGHALTTIIVQAAAAASTARRDRTAAAGFSAALREAADLAVIELARLGDALAAAPEVAAEPGLDALAARARRAGQAVDLTVAGDLAALPAEVRQTVERIVQEALTNAAKHATGARVRVAVRAHDTGAHVRVHSDAGRGGGLPGAGYGLRSMAERARRAGGRVAAGPAQRGAWVVEAWLGEPAPEG
jgi:signal transduction histidine kinase